MKILSRCSRTPVKLPAPFMGLAFFASVTVCSISTLSAQTDSIVSSPASRPISLDAITFRTGRRMQGHSTTGRFAALTLNPLDTADIKLRFPTSFASAPVIVQALDGGNAAFTQELATVSLDATISFQFQASNQPGLYRVLVIANGTASTVQFWVPSQTQ